MIEKSADKVTKPLHVFPIRQSNSYTGMHLNYRKIKEDLFCFQAFFTNKRAAVVFSSIGLGPMFSVCINYICALSYIIVLASNHKARERRLLHDADWFVGVVLDINRYIMTSLAEKRQ